MNNKALDPQSYPCLRNQLVRQRGAITKLLSQAGKSPPMNYGQFKLVADAALENIESAIQFLNNGRVEEAAICAIHAAEYFVAAGEATGLPYVRRGMRALQNSQKGHTKTYGTKEERLQRSLKLQVFIEGLKERRPDIKSHTALCAEAAAHKSCPHKLSGRVIQRNTKNPYS
jgi:nitrite reductase/ring-hydroxylating ferredoxin subunit